jgi:hypothetical protein
LRQPFSAIPKPRASHWRDAQPRASHCARYRSIAPASCVACKPASRDFCAGILHTAREQVAYLMQYSSLAPPPGANPKQCAAIRRKTEVSCPHRALIQSLTVPQCLFWHPICLFGIPFAFYGIHLPFLRPICLLVPICFFWRPICLPAPICFLAPHMPLWHPICLFGAPFAFWRRLYGAPFAFRHPHLP